MSRSIYALPRVVNQPTYSKWEINLITVRTVSIANIGNIVQDKMQCSVCKDFITLNDSYIQQYHKEWPDQWFFNYRYFFTCPCCTIQGELESLPHKEIIPDHAWGSVWRNLEEETKKLLQRPKPTDVRSYNSYGRGNCEEYEQTLAIEKYERALANGTAAMACGRIMTIRTREVKPDVLYTKMALPCKKIEGKSNYIFVTKDGALSEMTDNEETTILTHLAETFISKNGNSQLSEFTSSKIETIKVFSGSNSKDITKPETIEDRLKRTITNIVISIKRGTPSSSSERNRLEGCLPTLLNITDDYCSELFWDILPLFITCRSMFILAHGAEGLQAKDGGEESSTSTKEQIRKWIASINGTLSKRAGELYNALTKSKPGEKNPAYPIIVLADIFNSTQFSEELYKMHSDIKEHLGCKERDSLRILREIKSPKELVRDFVGKLKIETPLTWELFRSVLTYATKDLKYISIKNVAAFFILCTCDVKSDKDKDDHGDELQSALNFYHEHGAFLYFPDVEGMSDIIILDPKWLLGQYQLLTTFEDHEFQSLSDLLFKKGILAQSLCERIWKSDDLNNLSLSLLELLKARHLAAEITVHCEVIGKYKGKSYFVPFVLPSRDTATLTRSRNVISVSAPLHFTFPAGKYLPQVCLFALLQH